MVQTLYLPYEQVRHTVHDDYGSEGPYTGFYEAEGDAWYTGISLSPKGMCDTYGNKFDELTVGDEIYVVYAVYGTGSTFGSEGGYLDCVLVTKDEAEAELAKAWIRWSAAEDTKNRCKINHGVPYADPPKTRAGFKYVSAPWTGYFEWLQEAKVVKFVITA